MTIGSFSKGSDVGCKNRCALNTATGMQAQALGRSKRGFSSKLHAVCDALGNTTRFFVTIGQRSG